MNIYMQIDDGLAEWQEEKGHWVAENGVIVERCPPVPLNMYIEVGDMFRRHKLTKVTFNGGPADLEFDGPIDRVGSCLVAWVSKHAPQSKQLQDLKAKSGIAEPLHILHIASDYFEAEDLRQIIQNYHPRVIVATLSPTDLSFVRQNFKGRLLSAKMKLSNGKYISRGFYEYLQIKVNRL